MRREEVETLAKAIALANENHDAYPENELSSFLSMKGDQYDGKLMIVGRAVNGWRTTWTPGEKTSSDAMNLSKETVEDVTRPNRCPMLWVTDIWNGKENSSNKYKTRTSAYWRVAKKTVEGLNIADVRSKDWPSFLVWSNLYKLSHSEQGNPSERLQKIQFKACAELLMSELKAYKPANVLMLTGLNWAKPFLVELGIQYYKPSDTTFVEGVAQFEGTKIVIAQHPQGKKEGLLVGEVLSKFDN
ncbi:MAG: hypothetical protein FPO08_04100 [Geobacter sp.]|nr:MAG: hypothetical protein FPO08_04100 [Geobacter sp.]